MMLLSKDDKKIAISVQESWMSNKKYDVTFLLAAYISKGYIKNKRFIVNKYIVKRILRDYMKYSDHMIKTTAAALIKQEVMIEEGDNYIFPEFDRSNNDWTWVLFETAIYCLHNLSSFVTKLYIYLWWGYNRFVSMYGYPEGEFYCVSLAGLGRVLGYKNSKYINTKILAGLETLQSVGLLKFNNHWTWKTINGQRTHFYQIFKVNGKSSIQTKMAEWAIKDSDINTFGELVADIVEGERRIEEEKLIEETKNIKDTESFKNAKEEKKLIPKIKKKIEYPKRPNAMKLSTYRVIKKNREQDIYQMFGKDFAYDVMNDGFIIISQQQEKYKGKIVYDKTNEKAVELSKYLLNGINFYADDFITLPEDD